MLEQFNEEFIAKEIEEFFSKVKKIEMGEYDILPPLELPDRLKKIKGEDMLEQFNDEFIAKEIEEFFSKVKKGTLTHLQGISFINLMGSHIGVTQI